MYDSTLKNTSHSSISHRGVLMKLIPFYARGWEANSYLVISTQTAVLIDAGVPSKSVLEALNAENATLKYILLTHGHFDHTLSVDALKNATDAQVALHADDAEMLSDSVKSALYTFMGRDDTVNSEYTALADGDKLSFGSDTLTVIHTPGHSLGSVCYLVKDLLFTGDTLFNGGYGRYDLYGGSFAQLCNSITALGKLDGNLNVYPGHGDAATLKNALDHLNF